jgi:hypothetical protein
LPACGADMKKREVSRRAVKPGIVNLNGQLYDRGVFGQIICLDQNGNQIPRVRLSKKKRLKLRKKFHEINAMDSHELANRIIEKTDLVHLKSKEQVKTEGETV